MESSLLRQYKFSGVLGVLWHQNGEQGRQAALSLHPSPSLLLPSPLFSFIFWCCFYSPSIFSLLLSSAFQGLILASCAPLPLVALALPPKDSEPMSCNLLLFSNLAQQLRVQSLPSGATWTTYFALVLGYLSSWSVPRVRHKPWDWFPITTFPSTHLFPPFRVSGSQAPSNIF